MIVFEMEQGTEEWFAARAGKITASMFAEVRKTLKSGPRKGLCSAAADDYAFKLALEREAGTVIAGEEFETFAMKRGREMEEPARLLHEQRLGTLVQPVGFICDDREVLGASADGLIDDNGMAEYKCFVAPSKLNRILMANDDSDVMDQIQGGLLIAEREWCDFVTYVPQLESIGLHLTVKRHYRDDAYITALYDDIDRFNDLVMEKQEAVRKMRGSGAITPEESSVYGETLPDIQVEF
jgi:hypothetical protein